MNERQASSAPVDLRNQILLFGCLSFLFFCFAQFIPYNFAVPSDLALRKHYLSHKLDFARLEKLIESEPNPEQFSITPELVVRKIDEISARADIPDKTETLKKLHLYKTLLDTTRISLATRSWEINAKTERHEPFIYFKFWGLNPDINCALDEEGFLFTEKLPEEYSLISSIPRRLKPIPAERINNDREKQTYVSAIEGSWYACLIRWGNVPPTTKLREFKGTPPN